MKSAWTSLPRIVTNVGGATMALYPSSAAALSSRQAGSSAFTDLANSRTFSRPTSKLSGYSQTMPRMSLLIATGYANFADAIARPKIFFPSAVAVNAIVTDLLSGSTDFTLPLNTISAPLPSLGTGTTAVNRTLYSVTAPGSPTHDVTKPPPRPIVNMPCAIAVSNPTTLAISSSQWIGFRSPETPA